MSAPTSTTVDPSTSTSSPANNDAPPLPIFADLPGANPRYSTTDPASTYLNVTIDDFSPLISFSPPLQETGGAWVSPLTDSMSAVRPMEPRPWHLGTYRRTTQVNASFTVTFWGSELHLYGDVGPSYGPYSIEVDGGTPQVRSAHYPALAVGPAGYLDGVSGLSEGRHEVVVRTLPRREGILEAEGFLLDYVLVRQRVGPVVGSLIPGIVDIQGSAMEQAITNRTGTWRSWSVDGDVILPDGRDARQPKTFFATNERGARITHSFSNGALPSVGLFHLHSSLNLSQSLPSKSMGLATRLTERIVRHSHPPVEGSRIHTMARPRATSMDLEPNIFFQDANGEAVS